MIIPYKMTCFYPCHILPWYVTVSIWAFCCPPFLRLAGKDRRHETFPPFFRFYLFFSLTRLVKTSRREEVCNFFSSPTHQPTKLNLSALERSPFPQRPKQHQHLSETLEMKVVKRHLRVNVLCCTLELHLAFSILFSPSNLQISLVFLVFFCRFLYNKLLWGFEWNFSCNLAYFHKEILIRSSCCLLHT